MTDQKTEQEIINELENEISELKNEIADLECNVQDYQYDAEDAEYRATEKEAIADGLLEALRPAIKALDSEWVNKFELQDIVDEMLAKNTPAHRTVAKIVEAVIKLGGARI